MKSTTVKFNLYSLLITVLAIAGAYSVFPNIPSGAFVALSVLTMVVSQAITFLTPSGEWASTGANWSIGKWVTRIGVGLLSIGSMLTQHAWAVAAVAAATPLIEIIIRVYGSATDAQKAMAATNGAK